ncbi:hypothetical protein pb186bvf_009301 [Paramecium bursaria]
MIFIKQLYYFFIRGKGNPYKILGAILRQQGIDCALLLMSLIQI